MIAVIFWTETSRYVNSGSELGGCQGGHCPPKFCLAPQWPSQNFSGLFLKVLHRPLTAPLVAKLAPPVASPNENVWLRPCVNYNVSNQHWTFSSNLYNESNVQNKFAFKCWSFHASNVVHQLPCFCALCFAIFADEVVPLIFVLQTFSWNHSPIYFFCSTLSSLETFRNICVTLCCKRNTARHRT